MPPVSRKRKAPEPLAQLPSSSEDERLDVKVASTNQFKYKCPVDGCGKTLKNPTYLRQHHRTHSKVKPYKCTFPSCNKTSAQLQNLISHICNIHKQHTRNEAKKYVQVQKEVMAEETKQLGIKEHFTGTVYGEVMSDEDDDDDATVIQPTLPHFTSIHQTSTGHYICPISKCDHKDVDMFNLKKHYRVHCGSDYRPYKCIFPVSCQYAANRKSLVERHIRLKHIPSDNTDLDASDFVESRTDWLQMEDDLFNSAQIVSAPEIQRLRPFACTFDNCSKKFNKLTHLSSHLRTHTQSKPFKCSYPNCKHTANEKSAILRHIHSVHFNVPRKDCKNLSIEEKQRAEQYVVVNQEMIDNEEAQIANARIGSKHKRRKRNHHVDADNESPNYRDVRFEDATTEDEDDKDELTALLATVQPTN